MKIDNLFHSSRSKWVGVLLLLTLPVCSLNAQFQYGATVAAGKGTYLQIGDKPISTAFAGKVGGTVRYLFKGEKNKLFLQSGLSFETNGGTAIGRRINQMNAEPVYQYLKEKGFTYRHQSFVLPLQVGIRMNIGNGRALSLRTGAYFEYGIHAKVTAIGLPQVEGPNGSSKDFSYNPFYGGTGYLFKPVIPGFSKPLYISAVPFEAHGIGVLLGMDLELDTHWLINAEWQQRVSKYYRAPDDGGDFSPGMCTLGLTYLF